VTLKSEVKLSRYRLEGAKGERISILLELDVSGQRDAPAALYSLESTPGTHWIGDWVALELVWTQRLEG
jgi:hypothetical protein